jgi:hypothetical protein
MGLTEITGVIAVVVSVLYLGLQIRDNTKVLRSQAHYNALSLAQRPMEMMIENESLASVVNRSYADPDAMSADDWARFGSYAFIGFQRVGVPVLPASRSGHSQGAMGGGRCLLQGAGRDEARAHPLLVRVPDVLRRALPLLRRG